jgi:lipoprotein-anchoring transpeptidase ErfK/SrfK
VLALIDRGRVVRTYMTSSGAPSTPTVLGTFRVYRRDLGTNSLGMVDAVYFIRGYAVHGYASVPPYNASHGCLRIPIPDARSVHDWLTMGTKVIVYR